jgi:hypothetical protein
MTVIKEIQGLEELFYNTNPLLPEFHGISRAQLAADAAFDLAVDSNHTQLNILPGFYATRHQL